MGCGYNEPNFHLMAAYIRVPRFHALYLRIVATVFAIVDLPDPAEPLSMIMQ
jgi:hypothetical protein